MPAIHCNSITAHWDNASAPFNIANAVHIWRLQITTNLHLLPQCLSVLHAEEITRAASYHHEKDKNRFILSRGMLRFLLNKYTGIAPQGITMIVGENKKPYLQTTTGAIHYNMAHSGDLVLIAIADSPIGVDVEYIDPNFNYTEIIPTCFSNEEALFLHNVKERTASFYALWTRKEALLKATGKGIDDDLIHVPCLDGTHNVEQSIIGSPHDWTVTTFEADSQYTGCIVFSRRDTQITFMNAQHNL